MRPVIGFTVSLAMALLSLAATVYALDQAAVVAAVIWSFGAGAWSIHALNFALRMIDE